MREEDDTTCFLNKPRYRDSPARATGVSSSFSLDSRLDSVRTFQRRCRGTQACFIGQDRAWWISYLFRAEAERATRYRIMCGNTHSFLPQRNGLVPNTVHILLHLLTARTVCTTSPNEIPSADTNPTCRPPDMLRESTYKVSGPGARITAIGSRQEKAKSLGVDHFAILPPRWDSMLPCT